MHHTPPVRAPTIPIIQRIKVHRHMLLLGGDLGIENWRPPHRNEKNKSRVKSNLDSNELKFSGAAQSAGSRLRADCAAHVNAFCVFVFSPPVGRTQQQTHWGAHPSMAFYFNNHIYCCIQFALATSISGLVPVDLSESQFNPVTTAAELINSVKNCFPYQFTRETLFVRMGLG